jgi:exopolyphosphatase/guanosine-5'-triphosphate,3'-diphosphate pyrophosphatase
MSFEGEARLLLEAASLLHDIGYLINYAQHHKHSYHLIVHADLPGLTTRQVQVVANVARYHRAAEPKSRHRTFATLSVEDQSLVRGLSAILRIADGLDRTHMQSVRSVGVRINRGAAFMSVEADTEPAVDMWGAVRKSGLFKEVFGLLPHLDWTRPEPIVTVRPTKRQLADV